MSRDEDCRRRGRPSRAGLVLGLVAALTFGCRDQPDQDPTRDDPVEIGTTSGTPGASTGEPFIPGDEASDQCTLAPTIGAGRHHGSLRGAVSELDGACGRMGPDVFFRLEVPRRSDVWFQGFGVGFSPRIGVLPHTCTTDWADRTLACTEGVGTWLLDVAAGSSLVVSIGIDPEHPALDQPAPMEGDDPLDFAVDVVTRDVLDEGAPCEPASRGRCGSGLSCLVPPLPPDEPDAPPAEAVCTAVPGDTCQTAIEVSVPIDPGGTTVEIDPAALQTDAHAHSCGGARTRERVLRLRVPWPGPHGLLARVDHPEVGLAFRAPGCLLEQELSCADPVGIAGSLAAEISGSEAFLFVELPAPPDDDDGTGGGGGETDGTGEEAPIVVDIERFEPSPFE